MSNLVGLAVPYELPPDSTAFNVSSGLLQILNRDLKFAKTPRK